MQHTEVEFDIKTKALQLTAEFNTEYQYFYLTEEDFDVMSVEYNVNLFDEFGMHIR